MSDNTVDLVSDLSTSDDSGPEGLSKTSLVEATSSYGSLNTLISNVGVRITHVEVLMPLPILQRLDLTRYFIQTHVHIIGCEPSDAEVLEYLDLRRWPNVPMYDWVYARVTGISLALVSLSDAEREEDVKFP